MPDTLIQESKNENNYKGVSYTNWVHQLHVGIRDYFSAVYFAMLFQEMMT
jgi:hypothetical protein